MRCSLHLWQRTGWDPPAVREVLKGNRAQCRCVVWDRGLVCCVPAEAVLQLQEFHLPHNFCCLSVIWMRRIWAAGWGSVMI